MTDPVLLDLVNDVIESDDTDDRPAAALCDYISIRYPSRTVEVSRFIVQYVRVLCSRTVRSAMTEEV